MSIYDEFISRASETLKPEPITDRDRELIRLVARAVLPFMDELKACGLLEADYELAELADGIEYRWRLSDSRFLVIRGLRPTISTLQFNAGDYGDHCARLLAAITDGNSFLTAPICGLYPVLREREEPVGTYRVILAGVADLLALYRSGSLG